MRYNLKPAEREAFAKEIERSIAEIRTKKPFKKSRRKYFPRNDEELILLLEKTVVDLRAGRIEEV